MPELDFKGKEFVRNHHLTVPYRPLVPDVSKSVGEPDLSGNLIIHGDNLEALKALLPRYAGKVDCIFIDPPYNTGNEGWSYNDNVNSPLMREWLKANPINAEDMLRHDKWCCMMWPRLKLLWELLAESGLFWMTLDDNEIHRAKSMLEEIGGQDQEHFVCQAVWQRRTSPDARKNLAAAHDYVLCFRKNRKQAGIATVEMGSDRQDDYDNPDSDPRGPWASTDLQAQAGHATEDQFYPITGPTGVVFKPAPGRCWGVSLATFEAMRSDNRIWFGKKGNAKPRMKLFQSEREGVTEWTWWTHEEYGSTQEAKKELLAIMGTEWDETPKPTKLLKRILQFSKSDAIVLDSFAGSATAAHAVLSLNESHGGNRRFILVEMENYAHGVTAERVRRVINGYPFEGTQRETLKEEPLTWTKLKNAAELVQEVEDLKKARKDDFTAIKTEVKDGKLRVIGERKVTDKAPGLGGTFTYCTLGDPVDTDLILSGATLPSREAMAEWLVYTAFGKTDLAPLPLREGLGEGLRDLYVGKIDGTHVWLIYRPDKEYLQTPAAALTRELARRIDATDRHSNHLVFSAAKYVSHRSLKQDTKDRVQHALIPFSLFSLERD